MLQDLPGFSKKCIKPNPWEELEFAAQTGFNAFDATVALHGAEIPVHIEMKRIAYQQSFAIVVYQTDLTKIKQTENELKHQDVLLHTTNAVASMLMTAEPEMFHATLLEALHMLCDCLYVDRGYIWQNSVIKGKTYATQVVE